MTPAELEAAIQRLQVGSDSPEASEAGLQRQLQLEVFTRELQERQRPGELLETEVDVERVGISEAVAGTESAAAALIFGTMMRNEAAGAVFVDGLLTGLTATVPPGEIDDFLNDLMSDPGTFMLWYQLGLPVGLGHGLVNLVTGVIDLAKLAFWTTPMGWGYLLLDQAWTALSDPVAYAAASGGTSPRWRR